MNSSERENFLRKIHPEVDGRFIQEHPKKAEALVNSLPLMDQLSLVLQRRGKERMSLIMLSKRAQALVRLLPEQELYFTIKEIGEEETLPLLAMADHRQVTYIFDLEFWNEQALEPDRLFRWLDLLKQAGEESFRHWLKQADPELLTAIIQKAVTIFVPDPDDYGSEPWREKDLFSLDDQYYFEITDDKNRVIIERMLGHLRDLEQDKFYDILDEARMQVSTETEDIAGRVRSGRLEDHGFYNFEEAIKIYQYLKPERMKKLEQSPERPELKKSAAATYALTLPTKLPNLLALAMNQLSDAEREEFNHQFARLSNKVMIADALDLTRLESLSAAVEKVYGYVEIGLESWSEEKLDRAVELLRRQWLEHIFQAGFSQVLAVSKKALALKHEKWFGYNEDPAYLFGDLDGKRFSAVTLVRPKFYTGEKENETAEFKSLSEVRLAGQSIARAEAWTRMAFDIFGLDPDRLKELIEIYPFDLTFNIIAATSLINGVVRSKPGFEPLTVKELKQFIHQSMTPAEPPRKIVQQLRDEFGVWVSKQHAHSPVPKELKQELAEATIVSIENELGIVLDPETIDPKFITSVVLKAD